MDAKQWIAAYADRLGVAPPTDEEFDVILDLAAEASRRREAGRAGRLLAQREGGALAGGVARDRARGHVTAPVDVKCGSMSPIVPSATPPPSAADTCATKSSVRVWGLSGSLANVTGTPSSVPVTTVAGAGGGPIGDGQPGEDRGLAVERERELPGQREAPARGEAASGELQVSGVAVPGGSG